MRADDFVSIFPKCPHSLCAIFVDRMRDCGFFFPEFYQCIFYGKCSSTRVFHLRPKKKKKNARTSAHSQWPILLSFERPIKIPRVQGDVVSLFFVTDITLRTLGLWYKSCIVSVIYTIPRESVLVSRRINSSVDFRGPRSVLLLCWLCDSYTVRPFNISLVKTRSVFPFSRDRMR